MAGRPSVIVFDVNETLSDMAPMADRFADVGAPGHLAQRWFALLLRDNFALAAAGTQGKFAVLGEGCSGQCSTASRLPATSTRRSST